jgi:cobalt/nickel transport system permease protein
VVKQNQPSNFIKNIDARIKIITHLSLVFFTVSLNNNSFTSLSIYAFWLLIIAICSKTTPLKIAKRSLIVFPFILMGSISIIFFTKDGHHYTLGPLTLSHQGLLKSAAFTAKAYISLISIFLLTQTTTFSELTNGFRGIGVPLIFISLLEFTWRYLSLLLREIRRIKRAADSRGYGAKWIWQIKIIGNMFGALFIRSYNRGENIYRAMISRGYGLEQITNTQDKLNPKDLLYPLISIGLFAFTRTGLLLF